MASFNASSSSAPTGKWTYDVFLSFRGEDTRTNFVDHLYAALVERGIHTFKDDQLLRRGELISTELLKAIEESRFAVVVLSENYANSSWCLDELAKIMECRNLMEQRVLPVFYHVDPTDVRGQKRSFATAFQKHEEKFMGEVEKLNKWRGALVTASNLSGWHISRSVNDGESKFINKIVQEILGGIQPSGMETNLIGIEDHIDALSSLLDMEAPEGVHVVGIWGMGGIGKTTIAQALFRRISYKFEGSSFVKDVREYKNSGIYDLEQQIQTMSTRSSNKRVLLVLDDVDNANQLEFLMTRREWFGAGSRIIITTRDEHLLAYAHSKYKPNCLLVDQALELFSRYAFQKNSPPNGYEELSHRAINYTGYLPLALKVLGSFFHGRHASVWESALNRLAKTPNMEIFQTLKLSFDGLDVSEKEIFLDIACFFKGRDKEHVTRILDSFGFDPVIGISVLIEKSLVTVSNKKLGMHDLIQEMGWQIVCESFSKSRFWERKEIYDAIMRNRKFKAIEAIMLRNKKYIWHDDESLDFSEEVFRRMKNLRLLDLESKCSSREPSFLPDNLRWLCWHHYRFSSLPVEHLHQLVGLDMFGGLIKHLWKGRKILPNLKFVDLHHSRYLEKFPDVSGAPSIERLILSDCYKLKEVHQSLGFHKKLGYLDMSGCDKLKCLPAMIDMESLETLVLSDCPSLETFPEVSSSMVKLSNIYLDYCIQIEELPSSIGYLSGLSFLNLIGCENLKNIPNSVCELKHLKSLLLHKCNALQKLPEEIGSMENLEELLVGLHKRHFAKRPHLSIRGLTGLSSLRRLDISWRQIKEEDFPQNFHAFSSLEQLNLSGNSQLTQLPEGISHLSRLRLLELNMCCQLQNLHALPSGIQVLRARGCNSLEKIGDLSQEYEWLYKVWLNDCHELLEYEETGRNIDKMLQQSFLKKCAAVDHGLSIVVPGMKIPSWFNEQHGCTVTLKLPPGLHTQIMGFAICGVFKGDWKFAFPRIVFKIENVEKTVPKSEVDMVSEAAGNCNCNLWVTYIPFGFFQQMYHDFQPQDWSHINGTLVMTLKTTDGTKSVRCGAHVVYKEDVKLIQLPKTCIFDYGKLVHVDGEDDDEELGYEMKVPANTYVYEEKADKRGSDLLPLRTKSSQKRDLYRKHLSMTQCSVWLLILIFFKTWFQGQTFYTKIDYVISAY